MRVSIVVASRFGTSRAVAERFAQAAGALGHEAVLTDVTGAPSTPPVPADLTVVVGAVYANEHHADIQTWLRTFGEGLGNSALISVSLAAALGTDEGENMCWDYVSELTALTGWEPGRVATVAGALDESRYDAATRALLRVASWRSGLDIHGDVVLTDLPAVDALAKQWLSVRG